jgi:2-oxoacid:acceptor oxidoreductase gamma subunit (pyruvate/2-ketoisovalerate family)
LFALTSRDISTSSKPYEIRWHGRGGQGAITAAKIVAQAAYFQGYTGVTAAPSFGAERRGAPVSASTRISGETVLVVSQVETPDVVVVLDHTLLGHEDVVSGLVKGGWLVVNTWLQPKKLIAEGKFNIATANATDVCRQLDLIVAGQTVVNTAILGAFLRATKFLELENIEKVIKERFSNSAADVNIKAIKMTYDITELQMSTI